MEKKTHLTKVEITRHNVCKCMLNRPSNNPTTCSNGACRRVVVDDIDVERDDRRVLQVETSTWSKWTVDVVLLRGEV